MTLGAVVATILIIDNTAQVKRMIFNSIDVVKRIPLLMKNF